MNGKHSVKLNAVPKDVRRVILDEQTDLKMKCNCNFSQEKTVIAIIRKWKKAKGLPINGVPVSKIVEELNS